MRQKQQALHKNIFLLHYKTQLACSLCTIGCCVRDESVAEVNVKWLKKIISKGLVKCIFRPINFFRPKSKKFLDTLKLTRNCYFPSHSFVQLRMEVQNTAGAKNN